MRAENGFDEIFSSIGRLTEGIGMLLIPLSYRRFFKVMLLLMSGT